MTAGAGTDRAVVAAIDVGTTSVRCMLFDRQGRMVSIAQREQKQSFPRPGWVEQNAAELWSNVTRVVPKALALASLTASDVVAVGVANQRETTVVWDPRNGRPLAPALTWQDTRTEPIVDQLGDHADEIRQVTGLEPATYYAAPRLRWLLDNVGGLEARVERGEALFGTLESWVIWNLTGGPEGGLHLTDITNASRTLLLDLRRGEWSARMLRLLDINPDMLPRVVGTAEVYATCRTVLPGVPVGGALGDQQAALFGQTCFLPGEMKCTYGTGAFVLTNVGTSIVESESGLLPTIAYRLPGASPVYALEGPIAVTGSLVQWCRDQLGLIDSAPQIETLARTVDDNGGCYIVPAFSGLYAPHWDSHARGIVTGLTSYVTKGHLARAVLEATAWQTYDVVEAMRTEAGVNLRRLTVDGGMTANNLLMQFVADVLDVEVVRPLVSETVSLGAAYAAGLAVGYWPDLDSLRRNRHVAAMWTPAMDPRQRREQASGWHSAVARARADV